MSIPSSSGNGDLFWSWIRTRTPAVCVRSAIYSDCSMLKTIFKPTKIKYFGYCLAKVLWTGQTKNCILSVFLSICLCSVRHLTLIIELPTAWVLTIDIGYWWTPLPDKLSAEDRSFLTRIHKRIHQSWLMSTYSLFQVRHVISSDTLNSYILHQVWNTFCGKMTVPGGGHWPLEKYG